MPTLPFSFVTCKKNVKKARGEIRVHVRETFFLLLLPPATPASLHMGRGPNNPSQDAPAAPTVAAEPTREQQWQSQGHNSTSTPALRSQQRAAGHHLTMYLEWRSRLSPCPSSWSTRTLSDSISHSWEQGHTLLSLQQLLSEGPNCSTFLLVSWSLIKVVMLLSAWTELLLQTSTQKS